MLVGPRTEGRAQTLGFLEDRTDRSERNTCFIISVEANKLVVSWNSRLELYQLITGYPFTWLATLGRSEGVVIIHDFPARDK